jgi:5-carboxymethyl-2-hydroxymuconate isomerase
MTRVARFRRKEEGRTGYGIVEGDHVAECTGALGFLYALQAGDLAALKPASGGSRLALDEIDFLPPVEAPEKIICVGVNYANRNAEYRDGAAAASYPSLFVRFPGSFVGHGQPILRPRESEQLDYEGEIALVIGTPGRRIPRAQALDHVAGFTLANDGTLRDWTAHAKFNVTQGKNFDASGSLGPWIVPRSEIEPALPLRLTTRVNGELRQDDTTASMMFGFARLVEYVSTFTTLKTGDLILTGTPTGAGARLDPPRWLKPGYMVEIEVPEIGRLQNAVGEG